MPDNPQARIPVMPDGTSNQGALKEAPSGWGSVKPGVGVGDVDVSLLEESLRLSPWARMLANDDALNFAESLREAMEKRNAKP
jgi:hypothetical protein